MGASKVYFTNMRTELFDSVPAKLKRLLDAAGLAELDLRGKFVAIKTHFGEQGNVYHLRPEYTRAIAEEVTRLGGTPFVTDCNTLYAGSRGNAVRHLDCAELNGFTSRSCGCPVIIADGLKGDDAVDIPVEGSEYLDVAHIGRTILDADVLLTLTHAKGCASTAYGGVLKNLSMGCASKAGKMIMHSSEIPQVLPDVCVGCGQCLASCGQDAIELVDRAPSDAPLESRGPDGVLRKRSTSPRHARITERCAGCGHCLTCCRFGAIVPTWSNDRLAMQTKMAEYAAAVVGAVRQQFHVAIAIDITPQCDCFTASDMPMVPDIGMFASLDPVALDVAITDAICAQPAIEGGPLADRYAACPEAPSHLHANNPNSDWVLCQRHAEERGAGSRAYELVEIE